MIVKRNKLGRSVYADRDFKRGEIICVMRGGRRTTPKTLYYHGNNFRKAQINPLQIGSTTYIELTTPYRYFNHSCEPNAGVRDSASLVALRRIKHGEEITFDYSTTIDESFQCRCGAKRCRGVIIDFFGLPKKLQQSYVAKKAVPDFILQKYKRIKRK